jgi:hypothetical protein
MGPLEGHRPVLARHQDHGRPSASNWAIQLLLALAGEGPLGTFP